MELPEEIVAKFRAVAQERLTRIETEWAQVLSSVGDDTALHREVHTLKGESRVLGFTDVNLVAHKLENMLEVARGNPGSGWSRTGRSCGAAGCPRGRRRTRLCPRG